MTTSLRIAAPSSSPLASSFAAAGRARVADDSADAPSSGSANDSSADFRSIMEKQSDEGGREAKPEARPSRTSSGNPAPSPPKSDPSKNAPSKSGPTSNGAGSTQSANNTAVADASPLAAAPAPRQAGPIDISANAPADAPSPDQNSSRESLTSGDGSPNGDDTQADPGTLNLSALLPQRANGALNASTGAPAALKPRLAASSLANTFPGSSNGLTLDPQVSEYASDLEGSGAPQTAPAAKQTGSAQTSSPQSGNSPDQGPDTSDLRVEVSSTAPNSLNPVAFEAKLSPTVSSAASAGTAAQPVSQPSDQSGSRSSSDWAAAESNALPEQPAAAPKIEALFATGVTPAPAQPSNPTAPHAETHGAGAPEASPAADRMQPLIEAPAPITGSGHSITVKVPGTTSDTGIDLRFVDRGGDIHLSVRTPSADLAQELRGGLNDLVGKLEHAGIRAEVSNTAASQGSSSDSSANQSKNQSDPDGRGFGRNSGDSQSQQQEPRGSNRSRWMAALEDSTQFSKEQTL